MQADSEEAGRDAIAVASPPGEKWMPDWMKAAAMALLWTAALGSNATALAIWAWRASRAGLWL